MAVIDDMVVTTPDVSPADLTIDVIKAAIARQFWAYFYAHQDDELISRKVFFWKVSIHLRDLFPLFEKLFGKPDAH